MTLLAVTVLGRDRPGIVADATAALAELGGNLEDSTMTLLRGHFAMLLLVRTTSSASQVEQALTVLTADDQLTVDVRVVPSPAPKSAAAIVPGVDDGAAAMAAPAGALYVLSVHGADRPGIVSALTRVVAATGGSVTDLTTRLTGDLYLLLAEVLLPSTVDIPGLVGELRATADQLGVDVSLRPLETDDL